MMKTEMMAKEMDILNQDESTMNEVARKALNKMQAQILLKYEKLEAEGCDSA